MESGFNLMQVCNSQQLQDALLKLEPYMALTQNNNRRFQSGIGLVISDDYDDVSLKRTSLFKSTVSKSSFVNSALTGSYFSETEFCNSVFDESNLQYCHFIHTVFKGVKIQSTNLSYSNFFCTDFKDILFKGSTVSELLFDECSFENCTFTTSMLENAIFLRCTLKNVRFINTNVEFIEFNQCRLQDVIMPFQQLPYVYGAYNHVANGDIRAQTQDDCLTAEKYMDLQEALITYYISVNEYFPLTNLYLARQNLDAAYRCITLGLQSSIVSKNFRMLKFYCKLAVQGSLFPRQKLRDLYSMVNVCAKNQELNVYEQRDFVYNSAEIRALLLDNIYDFPTVQIDLQTNIDAAESDKVIRFIEYIDHTIQGLCSKQTSHIEYRHNSDANFITFLSAHFSEILLVIFSLLSMANNACGQVEQRIMNRQQIKLNELKIKKETAELKKLDQVQCEGEQLKRNGIEYEMKFYISNASICDSQEINLYL